jgi:predicted YcjX-like family ATPase
VLDKVSTAAFDTWDAAQDFAGSLLTSSVRLGVTGLARSGKTVFITALVHQLLTRGKLLFFDVAAQGRLLNVYLDPQPDDAVPRFDYEGHLAKLTAPEPEWPDSTRAVSELRLTFDYLPLSLWRRTLGPSRLHLDIIDYPGEWLLDLPLLDLSFEDWARQAVELARAPGRAQLSASFFAFLSALRPHDPQDETVAKQGAALFTAYLQACRSDAHALSSLPPGRFLMPGDLEGTPMLTFFPLDLAAEGHAPRGSLHAMLARRFESYKAHVVRPFFREHFARLDRQIVLADVLSALNAGAGAVTDMERALTDILACFRQGQKSWLNAIFGRRIDKIAFAATKADHLHQSSHDRLEAILRLITAKSMERASFAGADVEAFALASLRATREAQVKRGGDLLPCIVGTPLKGESFDGRIFDGSKELAIFPGDLPEDANAVLSPAWQPDPAARAAHFVRFRPPKTKAPPFGEAVQLPHIRLDGVLNFLIGDRLT